MHEYLAFTLYFFTSVHALLLLPLVTLSLHLAPINVVPGCASNPCPDDATCLDAFDRSSYTCFCSNGVIDIYCGNPPGNVRQLATHTSDVSYSYVK